MKSRLQIRHFFLAFLLAWLCGCGLPQSALSPHGKAADYLAVLLWIEVAVLSGVTVVMWILIVWASIRKRGSLDEHEPWDLSGGHSWALIGGFVVPFVILSVLFGLGTDWLSNFPVDAGKDPGGPEIQVIGHQWWWELHYVRGPVDQHFITADVIHIPAGRPVNIEVQTEDVIHSFWVPALHGKIDLIPGQPNFIRIEADRPGIYRGQCAEYCGEEHARMLLWVVAQTPQDYEAWRLNELQPASNPTSQEALHGRDVFMGAACALCHEIRGTMALGRVAPDLTHIGSRPRIASNYYDNNDANLEAWITHAQSLKPGSEMPNLTAFSGSDLRAMVAYLRQLK